MTEGALADMKLHISELVFAGELQWFRKAKSKFPDATSEQIQAAYDELAAEGHTTLGSQQSIHEMCLRSMVLLAKDMEGNEKVARKDIASVYKEIAAMAGAKLPSMSVEDATSEFVANYQDCDAEEDEEAD